MPANFDGDLGSYLTATGVGSGYYGTPYTVSAWIKVPSAASSGIFTMNRSGSSNREHTFEIRSDPLIRYGQQGNTSAYMAEYSVTYATGSWFNVIWVVNSSSDIDIYYNNDTGAEALSPSTVAEDYVNLTDIAIGRINDSSPSNQMPDGGKIAEVAVWLRAITAAERTDLQTKKPSEIAATSRKNYWSLDNVLTDAWGGLTLTANGNVTVNSTDHPSLSGGGGAVVVPIPILRSGGA